MLCEFHLSFTKCKKVEAAAPWPEAVLEFAGNKQLASTRPRTTDPPSGCQYPPREMDTLRVATDHRHQQRRGLGGHTVLSGKKRVPLWEEDLET